LSFRSAAEESAFAVAVAGHPFPEVRVAYNDGYYERTLRELLEIVEANKDLIERAWNEFFR
jgi:hypothetical protein